MRSRYAHWIAVLAVVSMACASSGKRTGSAADPNSCALVLGGGGLAFDDPQANRMLFVFNSAVSDSLHDNLSAAGYRVEKLILENANREQRLVAAGRALQQHRCDRLIQVGHFVEGPETARRFGFQVSVLVPAAHRFDGKYEKRYSYPLTEETLRNLRPSDIAKAMGRDLSESGLLAKAAPAGR